MRAVPLALAMLGIACAQCVQAESILDRTRQFDIDSGALDAALLEFSKQARIAVSTDGDMLRNYRTSGVRGAESARVALAKLLADSGLTYRVVNDVVQIAQAEGGTQDPGSDAQSLAAEETGKSNTGPAAEPPELEEIIVTSQRRAERLQDVPISVSVLSGSELDRAPSSSAADVLSRVPGVLLDSGSGTTAGGSQLSIRGAGAPGAFANGSSPVGYYLDTVPFGLIRSAVAPDANVYDLKAIEVLRGPQGTLYGASAQAGVVRILTQDANLSQLQIKSRALVSHTQEGGENGQIDAALNVPLIDGKLAARAVVGYEDESGWIDKSTRKDVNDGERVNARLKLNSQLTDQLSVGVSAWMSRSDSGAMSVATDGEGQFSAIADVESVSADFETYSLNIGYDFPAFSLTSTTSYLDYENDNDVSQNAARTRSFARTVLSARTFAQEVNLASTHEGPWRWTAGAIYRDGKDQQFQDITPNIFPALVKYSSESWAAFGELTRIFFEGRLELTAGLRRFEDRVAQRHEVNASNLPPPAGLAPPAQDGFHATTPRFILSWHPQYQTTVYASYAEGFRSGLHQNPTARLLLPTVPLAQPDMLKNYEIGAKGSMLDGRVSYDAAVYYMDWQDVQLPLGVFLEGIIRSLLLNGASASGLGADLGLNVEPTPGLNLGFTASWNDLTVDQDVFSNNVVLFARGERLNASIEATAGVTASYRFPLGDGLHGTLAAGAEYRTRLTNKTVTGSNVVVTRGDPVTMGRASFALDFRDRWTATVFVDNVANTNDVLAPANLVVVQAGVYPRPRTIGLQLEYSAR